MQDRKTQFPWILFENLELVWVYQEKFIGYQICIFVRKYFIISLAFGMVIYSIFIIFELFVWSSILNLSR